MPMDRGTPDLVRHCVAAVAKEYGGDVDRAFAICVATLQKAGYLKKGTMELTAAGKAKEKEHEKEPDAKKKLKAYEDFLKAAKETRKAEREETQAEAFTRDFNLLLNPTKRTGLEAVPRPIARKYEMVTKQESSMDFMRRLAGITTRYDDRTVRAEPVVEEQGYKCLECGKKFKTVKAAEKAMDEGCPKCGGSDIDLA